MVQNGPKMSKWSNCSKFVKKIVKMVKNGKTGLKWSKMVKIVKHGGPDLKA